MIPTKRIWTAKPFLVAYVVAVGFTVGLLVNRTPTLDPARPVLANGESGDHGVPTIEQEPALDRPLWLQLFRPSQPTARWMLRMGLPLLSIADGSAQQSERRHLLVYWSGQAGEQPQTLFQSVLPFLRPERAPVAGSPDITLPPEPPPQETDPGTAGQNGGTSSPEPPPPKAESNKPEVAGGLPLVGIYHTHNWESYISEFPALKSQITKSDDLDRIASEDPKIKTIVDLGKKLAVRLSDLGVTAVHSPLSHSRDGYPYAYRTSRSTAREILKTHPTVKVLLDLHRDSGWGVDTIAVIQRKNVARIRCVIGQEKQPRWEQNRAFCERVIERLEKRYPGITLETRVQNDTYNQDLMPGAVLLEIGGALNSYAEAERSVLYLAEVLAELAREGAYP